VVQFDYVLVGGGLQNALLAEAVLTERPGARLALVERGGSVGGNHTWCFHAADVPAAAQGFVEPFVVQRWPRHAVTFPHLSRVVEESYSAITSERVASVIAERARRGELLLALNETAQRVEARRVELASGSVLEGKVVVDARGPDGFPRAQAVGYQKFLGLELEVQANSAPAEPVLMDASVQQIDGFRFFYVLPFSPERVLVEDTYFSEGPELDRDALRDRVLGYAAASGFAAKRVIREEAGVLPLPARPPGFSLRPGLVVAGYRGGFFHPTTGYSFPLAVRVALAAAQSSPAELPKRLHELALHVSGQQRFATLLNRMLFHAYRDQDRYGVLERFYRLPAATIRRFYALDLSAWDRARILLGRPPRGLSLSGLVTALKERSEPLHPQGAEA
jgi:lycopene beta-cyclase